MEKGVPDCPKDAATFLGAVAFLRRMIPRISLLAAPMIKASKSAQLRRSGGTRRNKPEREKFTTEEQAMVDQSWQAVVEYLDSDAVLAAPDYDDPNAEFVICTDASDYAVGGVLMQWQHSDSVGPGPPKDQHHLQNETSDPISSKWRLDAGWELRILGYYSKTLDVAQRNYPAFDKEAGAILLCIRHWSDVITYHKTRLYTDSSVATSMLTKHAAPPRLQRWGVELGSYLPHLQISYRKGADNGLADLLSRFPAFNEFTKLRSETVALPDDLFDHVGDAPLYHRESHGRSAVRDYSRIQKVMGSRFVAQKPDVTRHVCQLYDPKRLDRVPENFWCSGEAPEIPGRGMTDRAPKPKDDTTSGEQEGQVQPEATGSTLDVMAMADVAEMRDPERLCSLLGLIGDSIHQRFDLAIPDLDYWLEYVSTFRSTSGRSPIVLVEATHGAFLEDVVRECDALGCQVVSGPRAFTAGMPDLVVCDSRCLPSSTTDTGRIPRIEVSRPGVSPDRFAGVRGGVTKLRANFLTDLPRDEPLVGWSAPLLRLRCAIAQGVAWALHDCNQTPVFARPEEWQREAVRALTDPQMLSPTVAPERELDDAEEAEAAMPSPGSPLIASLGMEDSEAWIYAEANDPRNYHWQEASDSAGTESKVPAPEFETPPMVTLSLEHQLQDPGLRMQIQALSGERRVAKAILASLRDSYELLEDGLYRIVFQADGEIGRAFVVPILARAAVLARYHYSLADGGGHSGGKRMYDQIKVDFYWDGMERECHAFVGACEHCGGTRSQATFDIPPGLAPTPERPFQVIHVDHKGSLPMSQGCTHVLVVVCALTRFTLYIPCKNTTGAESLKLLEDHVFSIFGYPLVVVSDNGSSFANKLMKASEELYGFRWVYVMPHTPQANGLAESAVKKLKIMLDRHTDDYLNWHSLLKTAQSVVNQRVTAGTQSTPFANLFGRQPVTLASLEQPELLPTGSPAQKSIAATGFALQRLYARLRASSDAIKRMAVDAHKSRPLSRNVEPGDKVWLVYSDSERSRYLRKHGHGRAWRHPYKVLSVKPHAVKLEVPTDGSVPEVLPWQSLRKCSAAAPLFHSPDLPVPDVLPNGLPSLVPTAPPTDPSMPDAWQPVDPSEPKYTIERIISAEPRGSGWTLQVKWKGYDEITPEPLGRILRDIAGHEGILGEIDQCQKDYYLKNPKKVPIVDEPLDAPLPTRTQPERPKKTTPYVFLAYEDPEPQTRSMMICQGFTRLRQACHRRINSLNEFQPDSLTKWLV